MSKKIVLALSGNALGDDLAGQIKAVKVTSQAIVNLITQGHEAIVTHGNGSQVGMIGQVFEAATKTEAHSPVLSVSVYVTLSQDYIGYDLQSVLREKLLSRGISKPVATLATQAEVDANDPTLLNSTELIGLFFTEQEAEQLTGQSYILKEDVGHGYHRVVASSKSVDIIEKETVKTLVDADQVVITVGGGGTPIIRESNHLRSVSAVIGKDWASARLAEIINVDILIILTAVEKMAVSFGKENEQWLNRLSLSGAERFIKEDHLARGSMLSKAGAAAPFARSRAGRGVLITILSKAKEEIEGKTGTVVCQ